MFEKIWQDLNPSDALLTFEQFLNFMTKAMVDSDTAEQVMNSFKVLAGDKVCFCSWPNCIVFKLSLNAAIHNC